MNRNKARARVTAERTGKPHLYVYNGVKYTEWLWEGVCDDAQADQLAAWCTRMDRIRDPEGWNDEDYY